MLFFHGRKFLTFPAIFLALFCSVDVNAMGKKGTPQQRGAIPSDPVTSTGALDLRVLSYNVQGLPPPVGGSLDRLKVIGKLLNENRNRGGAPQVVFLQESWFERDSQELIRNSGYPYVMKGPGSKFGKITGSGIYILSDYPLSEYSAVDFDDCSGPDCYATKAAMRVRVHIPGLPEPFYLFNTHLNADSAPMISVSQSMAVRMRQLRQIHTWRALMRLPAGPKIFAGDFNAIYGNRDFSFLAQTSNFRDAHSLCLMDGCSTVETDIEADRAYTLDHVFSESGKEVQIKPFHLDRNYREQFRGQPLSDHLALEVHYQVRW